ncbi:MAG: hypothetical protein EXR32_00360 [Betaproteobacteria bacterium]|nr:hypothetical protein [Betaproteobacteria bacterium]
MSTNTSTIPPSPQVVPPAHERPSLGRFHFAGALVVALVLTTVVWIQWQIRSAQSEERALLLEQTAKRAAQLADAVGERLEALVRRIDFGLQQLRGDYRVDDAKFRILADSFLASFPKGAIEALTFVNANGEVTYSSFEIKAPINISDREFFKAHQGAPTSWSSASRYWGGCPLSG